MYIDNKSKIKKVLDEYWADCYSDSNPKDRRMKVIEEKNVHGMNTENIRLLINEIVKRFAKKGVYLEIGTLKGSSLLSAALFNTSTRCIGIDNFSELDLEGKNEIILRENLEKFGNPKNIEFYNMDYRDAFKSIFLKDPNLKINVYYLDGSHKYEDEIKGFNLALPYLSKECAILIDDVTWFQVDMAKKQFLKENHDFKTVFEIKPKMWQSNDWWNGFQVITRGI